MGPTKLSAALLAASMLLSGCATTRWFDGTGQGRGRSQFSIDSGNCQLTAQQAGYGQQALVNQQNANGCYGTRGQCASLGFVQGMSVAAARNEAYTACMQAAGWMPRQR